MIAEVPARSVGVLRRVALANVLVVTLLALATVAVVYESYASGHWRAASGPSLVALIIIIAVAFVAYLIVSRQPENRLGPGLGLIALLSVLTGLSEEYTQFALISSPGALPEAETFAWLTSWLWAWSLMPLLTLLFIFCPDGRLPSPRWKGIAIFVAADLFLIGLCSALRPGPLDEFPETDNPYGTTALGDAIEILGFVCIVLLLPSIALSAAAMIARFRRSRGIERLQLKWFVTAAVASLGLFILAWIIALQTESDAIWGYTIFGSAGLVLLATANAILRYRLFDIDFIISRALVYGSLTAILAGLYAASIQLFKLLLEAVTGEGSDASIVLTTLLLAAVFTPIKNALQKLVDRYYGHTHEPLKELRDYGSHLRSVIEVFDPELNSRTLTDHLVHSFGSDGAAVYVWREGIATLLAASGNSEPGPVPSPDAVRIPLESGGTEVGFLALGLRPDSSPFDAEEMSLVTELAGLLAKAMSLNKPAAAAELQQTSEVGEAPALAP